MCTRLLARCSSRNAPVRRAGDGRSPHCLPVSAPPPTMSSSPGQLYVRSTDRQDHKRTHSFAVLDISTPNAAVSDPQFSPHWSTMRLLSPALLLQATSCYGWWGCRLVLTHSIPRSSSMPKSQVRQSLSSLFQVSLKSLRRMDGSIDDSDAPDALALIHSCACASSSCSHPIDLSLCVSFSLLWSGGSV